MAPSAPTEASLRRPQEETGACGSMPGILGFNVNACKNRIVFLRGLDSDCITWIESMHCRHWSVNKVLIRITLIKESSLALNPAPGSSVSVRQGDLEFNFSVRYSWCRFSLTLALIHDHTIQARKHTIYRTPI